MLSKYQAQGLCGSFHDGFLLGADKTGPSILAHVIMPKTVIKEWLTYSKRSFPRLENMPLGRYCMLFLAKYLHPITETQW